MMANASSSPLPSHIFLGHAVQQQDVPSDNEGETSHMIEFGGVC